MFGLDEEDSLQSELSAMLVQRSNSREQSENNPIHPEAFVRKYQEMGVRHLTSFVRDDVPNGFRPVSVIDECKKFQ